MDDKTNNFPEKTVNPIDEAVLPVVPVFQTPITQHQKSPKNWTRTAIIMTALTVSPIILGIVLFSDFFHIVSGEQNPGMALIILSPMLFLLPFVVAALLIPLLTIDLVLAFRYLRENKPELHKRVLPYLAIVAAIAAPVALAYYMLLM